MIKRKKEFKGPAKSKSVESLSVSEDSQEEVYLRGMKREEFVEPMPGRPWRTGL